MDRIRPLKVLIAEDSDHLRTALTASIGTDPSLKLVGAARDAEEAIEIAAAEYPDVALLDVKMPFGGGVRAAREITAANPDTKVLVLSAYGDRTTVMEMLTAGAIGYLVKGSTHREVLDAIHKAAAGESILSPEVTGDVITRLKTLVAETQVLAQRIAWMDKMKSELIQNLAHELLTPVTVIQGVVTTLADRGETLPKEQKEFFFASSLKAVRRIRRLAVRATSVARLDHDGESAHLQTIDIVDVVQAAIDELELDEGAVSFERPAAPIHLSADIDMARVAVSMLIENAVEYSGGAEPPAIGVEADGEHVVIKVSDRGPGVPAEVGEQIFDLFRQVDGSATRTHEGLGVGLYLARRIARAHGGDVTYSDRPGGGTVFTITLGRRDHLEETVSRGPVGSVE